jgi:hypothetical protein
MGMGIIIVTDLALGLFHIRWFVRSAMKGWEAGAYYGLVGVCRSWTSSGVQRALIEHMLAALWHIDTN